MAIINNKNAKKSLLSVFQEYNISKVDIIIYASILFVLVATAGVFIFLSKSYINKQNIYEEVSQDAIDFEGLKKKEAQITKDFANLDASINNLRNKFFSEKQVNEFKEEVKKLAKTYKCDRIDVTEGAESREQVESLKIKTRDGEVKTVNIKFKKRSVDFFFQMSLGNFTGFLKSLETCNKMLEIQPFRIAQGDEKNVVKLTKFNVMLYMLPAELETALKGLTGAVTFEDFANQVKLGEKVEVHPINVKNVLAYEIVKAKGVEEWKLLPIFRTIEPPKPKLKVPPADLRIVSSSGSLVAFMYNKDANNIYYGTVGGNLETRDKKRIAGYEAMKLIEINQKKGFVVLELDEVTGELSRLKQ